MPGPARRRSLFSRQCVLARWAIEEANLGSGLAAQALLIGLRTRRGTESHSPVAMDDNAELAAAMVAPERHEPRLQAPRTGAGAR